MATDSTLQKIADNLLAQFDKACIQQDRPINQTILVSLNEICFIPLIGTDKGKEVMKNLFKEQLKRQKK